MPLTCRHLSGTHDQLNSPCLASMETVAQRIAQIVEAYSGGGGAPLWAGVRHYEGRTSATECIDPNLRADVAKKTREELDLENFLGKLAGLTGVGRQGGATTGAGDGADGEGTFPVKGGSRQKRRARGLRIKSLGGAYGVVLDSLFPLPSVYELGPRPQGRKQVRALLCDKKRVEDVISDLNWCSGSKARFAVDSVPTPRQDLVIARVRELVDRSVPTFAIPGQRVAFLKPLRDRGVYDTRDGGLSLASFRSASKIYPCGISPR